MKAGGFGVLGGGFCCFVFFFVVVGGVFVLSGYLDIDEELCLASGRHLFWQRDVLRVASYPSPSISP